MQLCIFSSLNILVILDMVMSEGNTLLQFASKKTQRMQALVRLTPGTERSELTGSKARAAAATGAPSGCMVEK